MPKVQFDMDSRGVEELLSSAEMRGVIDSYTQQIAGKAASMSGQSYTAISLGQHRAMGIVRTADWAAVRENLKNNTLERAYRGQA